ncbi:MAG: hypothetical protein ACYC91_13215 [Solirubrobacteraceae bacterium]
MSLTELTAASAPLLTLLVASLAADFAVLPVDFARELALLLRLLPAGLELPLRPRVAARVFPYPEEPFEDELPWDDARREDPLRVVAVISLSLRLVAPTEPDSVVKGGR